MAFEQLRFSSTFVGISRELKMDRLHILPRMLICLLLEQKGVPQTFLLWAHSLVHKHNFCQAESHFRPQGGAAALNMFHEATALRKRTSAVHNFPSFRKNLSQSILDWVFPIHEKMVFSQAVIPSNNGCWVSKLKHVECHAETQDLNFLPGCATWTQ